METTLRSIRIKARVCPDPVVAALVGREFLVEDTISSSLVYLFTKISRDKNPIHRNKADCKKFGLPCDFKPMHGMLMASRIGGLIWEVVTAEAAEPVRPVILDGVPRFRKFMRLDEPFTLKLKFSFTGRRDNQLLFRLALEVLQRGEICLEGETRTVLYKEKPKVQGKRVGSE